MNGVEHERRLRDRTARILLELLIRHKDNHRADTLEALGHLMKRYHLRDDRLQVRQNLQDRNPGETATS